MGASTALFAYLTAIAWPTIDAPEPERTVWIYTGSADEPRLGTSYPEYRELQRLQKAVPGPSGRARPRNPAPARRGPGRQGSPRRECPPRRLAAAIELRDGRRTLKLRRPLEWFESRRGIWTSP